MRCVLRANARARIAGLCTHFSKKFLEITDACVPMKLKFVPRKLRVFEEDRLGDFENLRNGLQIDSK